MNSGKLAGSIQVEDINRWNVKHNKGYRKGKQRTTLTKPKEIVVQTFFPWRFRLDFRLIIGGFTWVGGGGNARPHLVHSFSFLCSIREKRSNNNSPPLWVEVPKSIVIRMTYINCGQWSCKSPPVPHLLYATTEFSRQHWRNKRLCTFYILSEVTLANVSHFHEVLEGNRPNNK